MSGGFTAPYKQFEFSKPGVPLLQHNSSCAWVTWPCLHHPVGTELGKQRKYWPADYYYCSVRNKKVLYLLPQSLSSAAAIPNLSVCKTFHSSWQSHILKVHSHKMHNNKKNKQADVTLTGWSMLKSLVMGYIAITWLLVWCIERNTFHCATSKHKQTSKLTAILQNNYQYSSKYQYQETTQSLRNFPDYRK